MDYELDIEKAEKELKNPSKPKKDNYKDLKGLAFEHSADNPRGRQERKQYREGLRKGIGGTRHKEHR